MNIIEPKSGILLDPACGSGGMFVQSGDFINQSGMSANSAMTFYGQEKVEYNAQLCLMNRLFMALLVLLNLVMKLIVFIMMHTILMAVVTM